MIGLALACSLCLDWSVYATGAADVWSTEVALRSGASEQNPLVPGNAVLRSALTAGGAYGVNALSREMRRRGNRAWWVPQAFWIAARGYAVARNLHEARDAE